MIHYSHSSISINGRFVDIGAIIGRDEKPLTVFEESTFSFIRSWLFGEERFVITTSGSTGKPKPINITRDQMLASARLTQQAINLKSSDTSLICIDTKFIGGMMMLVRALAIGQKIIAVDPCANPLEKLTDQWVSFAAFVPYQIENILESKRPHLLDSVEKVIIGGAPLSETTRKKLDDFRTEFYATYGMTETVSHVALKKLNGKDQSENFETLPGITIDLDERGCLILNVPYLPRPIITNDIAEKISNTSFKWIGRFDNIINSGGIKVNPERVEHYIDEFQRSSGHNLRFFVHGIEDQQLGSRIILVIEANKIDEQFLSSLYSFLAAVLSSYEIPKEVYLVEAFSETENRKINRLQTVKGLRGPLALKK